MPLQTRKKLVEIVSGTGAIPSGSLTNTLEITEDSDILMDQTELNSQADVVSNTMTKRKSIVGRLGGTPTMNGNLVSTDGTNPPPIGKGLLACGMAETEGQILNFADVIGLAVGDDLLGDISGATGKVRHIDGTKVLASVTSGTFTAEGVNTGAFTISSVEAESIFTYTPDSSTENRCGIFPITMAHARLCRIAL